MREASDTAYKGVIKPVEGTILTVAREAAVAADQVTREYGDLVAVADYIVGQTRQAVARTPSQLAVLAEAGVVDAGGQGLYVMLEGMLRYLRGEPIDMDAELASAVDLGAPSAFEGSGLGKLRLGFLEPAARVGQVGYGYDVQFIIVGQELDVESVRADIDAMVTPCWRR
jgi:hypothetical protein